jgi:hypothetical protein
MYRPAAPKLIRIPKNATAIKIVMLSIMTFNLGPC